MKKIFFLVLCSIFAASAMAYAHPPSDIKITFDPQTKNLNAIIYHHVSNYNTHYIYKVDIGVNGEEVQSLSFKKQMNYAQETVNVPLPGVKAGDILSVEAYCNLSGRLEKTIKAA